MCQPDKHEIFVTWSTSATSSDSPGEYAINPILSDLRQHLGNYAITTNLALLKIVDTRAAAFMDSQVLTLRFPVIPGLRYGIESTTNLASPIWRSHGFVNISTDQPQNWTFPAPDLGGQYFLRVTPNP